MSDQTDKIQNYLFKLNLTLDESRVYIYLNENSKSSALDISRKIHIARTKVYRILDKLIEKKLVVQILEENGRKFETTSPKQLEMLLVEKEQELETLKKTIPLVISQLEELHGTNSKNSKVLYYEGISGLKQITWNSLKAKGELLIYEVGTDMSAFLDKKFSEKVREELVLRKILTRQLTNHKKICDFTNVTSLVKKYWEVRYVSPADLKMNFEVLIYNNVYVAYNYSGKDIFCVEIYNQSLADMQRQLFEFVWKKSKVMKIISDRGGAEV